MGGQLGKVAGLPPAFVQRTQLGMLGVLAEAEDLSCFPARLPYAIEVVRESWAQLATGRAPQAHLLVTRQSAMRQGSTASTPPQA